MFCFVFLVFFKGLFNVYLVVFLVKFSGFSKFFSGF